MTNPLQSRLSWRESFRFPLQHALARKELLIGGLWLLVPGVGWVLNMGHRIMLVHQLQRGEEAWPAWHNYPQLFRHGLLTFLGMVLYHIPAVLVLAVGYYWEQVYFYWLGAGLWGVATMAVPGYMSHYCKDLDPWEIFDPFRALRRVRQGGLAYWKAWGIALAALGLSFSGLLLGGIGFLWTSVWFWQVAAIGFAQVFTREFGLDQQTLG